MRGRTLFVVFLVVLTATTTATASHGVSTGAVGDAVASATVGDAVVPQVGTGSGAETGTNADAAVEPTHTNFTVRFEPRGDAEWTVSVGVGLAGPNETRAFRALGERYESGEAEIGPEIAPFEKALAAANENTDREMSFLDVSRSARIENGTGYLTIEFVWTNFAVENGGRMRVGDAFRTRRGTWLPGLAANQSLVFVPPPGYGVNSAPIGPDNGTLRWEGPQEFEPGYLAITYRRGLGTATSTRTPAADAGAPLVPIAGVALIGVCVLAAVYLRSQGLSLPSGDADTESTENDASGGGTGRDPVSVVESVASVGTATGAMSEIDEELLSDEERVERLLRTNGGRMRQASIVTETQWSNAKVSQLLSAMDRENRIDKLRIGRENLISLPDEDVSDADAG